MTSHGLARDYLRKAKARRRALQTLLEAGSYDDVVREGQEIVELMLKGVLRWVGVDPPRRHDIGATLRDLEDRLPPAWRARLEHVETVSKTLFEERGHAFYGDETSLTPAAELFGVEDARRVAGWVDELLGMFEELLREPRG
ncbi:MAG TPA: HEPN domain-containing protein [Candidatus Methylomirabilis sp.]|jgi:HEPN domain-containing protein